jgi:predicted PurR-regulated permease PerM
MDNKKGKFSLLIILSLAIFIGVALGNVAGGLVQSFVAGCLSCFTALATALVEIFIMKHMMHFMEEKLFPKVIKGNHPRLFRILSLVLSALLLLGFIVLIVYLFVPKTITTLSDLISGSENYIAQLKTQITELISLFVGSSTAESIVAESYEYINGAISGLFTTVLPEIVNQISNIFSVFGQIFLGIVVGLFYLVDREKVNNYLVRLASLKLTEKQKERTGYFLNKSDKILIDFVIAKLIECIFITIVLGVIMTILGVNSAFELAFLVGVLNVIPYVGYIIALVPMILLTLVYGSVSLMLQTVAIVTVAYVIITSFITPFIVGSRVKINMIVMFLSLIIGGGVFGFVGMLIGVPVGAIISEFVNEHLENKEKEIAQMKEKERLEKLAIEQQINNEKEKKKSKNKKSEEKENKETVEQNNAINEEKAVKQTKFKNFFAKFKKSFSSILPEDDEKNDKE